MSENMHNKKYEALKISNLKVEKQNEDTKQPPREMTESTSLDDEMFYEIEYDSSPIPGVGKFVLKSQKIEKPEKDDIRELFDKMRDITREYNSLLNYSRFFDKGFQHHSAVIFYQQGLFMKDFTDDYKGNKPFSKYFPYYQMMGYEQLRTYFTWRTAVRNGNVADTSLSYAFLYIYELIGNIGVNDPQDGLDKLMFFWKNFKEHNKAINKYVLRWLKDYHIYYELPHTFKEFVEKNNLTEYYPNLKEMDNSFEMFCMISKYKIEKSNFYTENTSDLISECFVYVMDKIRHNFDSVGISFDEIIFHPTKALAAWIPFKEALFYHSIEQPDRHIILSANEVYLCKDNQWRFSTTVITDKGKQLIGYIMKQMESVLRKIKKYKYKLTANTDMINGDLINLLKKSGLFIDKIVTNSVMEYHKEATKTIVEVNPQSLARIREEATKTQESLIVEEISPHETTKISAPIFVENDKVTQNDVLTDLAVKSTQESDTWGILKGALTDNELQALSVVLQGDNIKAFSDEYGVMVEVLVDGINEKSMDYIGDSLIDEDFYLYDEYKEKVKELIK